MGMHPAAMPTTMEMTIWKNFMTMPTTAMGIWAYCCLPEHRVQSAVLSQHIVDGGHGGHQTDLGEEAGDAQCQHPGAELAMEREIAGGRGG